MDSPSYLVDRSTYLALRSAIPTDQLGQGDQILSKGSNALVVRRGDYVIKIRIRSTEEASKCRNPSIHTEIAAYKRLTGCEGVVSHRFSCDTSITLGYMSNGSLFDYLVSDSPPKVIQRRWFLQIATALATIHDKCIIHTNISTKNLLVDSNLALHFCGFSNAILLDPGTNMEQTTGAEGCSIYTDMAQFGNIIYDIVDEQGGELESRGLTHVWLGEVIGKCWIAGYQNARVLCSELQRILDEDMMFEEIFP